MFDTENVALSKDRSAMLASHNDYSDTESVDYWWNATQWDESMTFDETSADLVGSYDWLSYHFSDLFTCTSHEECPSTGFCASSDSKCKLCADCVFDADGIGGTCSEKCPAVCHGAIPPATCPFCGASGAGGLKMPPSATGAITISKNATNLTWCSPQDYQDSALSLTSEASVEVLITYFESPISEAEMYTKSFTYKINPLSSEITKFGASSDCDHPYSVQLPQIDAYTKIHAEIKLYDECQQPLSSKSASVTSPPGPPTWFTSNNHDTRVEIVPSIVGSTSEVAALQWKKPLLNCGDCEIEYYEIYQKATDEGEYVRREESTQETVALLRDLTTGSAYTFKVVATVNKYGDSDKSPSSADFTVTAEVPDKPPLIYFERDRRTPYSSAKATVVVGSVNGAPIDSYTLEYWINQTDVTPARTTLVQIQTAPSVANNTFELNDLSENTPYVFRSKIENSIGSSEYSADFEYSTTKIKPTKILFVSDTEPKSYDDRDANTTWYNEYEITLKVTAGESSGNITQYALYSKILADGEDGNTCKNTLISEMNQQTENVEGSPSTYEMTDTRKVELRNNSYTLKICYCAEVFSEVGDSQKSDDCYFYSREDPVRSCRKDDYHFDTTFQEERLDCTGEIRELKFYIPSNNNCSQVEDLEPRDEMSCEYTPFFVSNGLAILAISGAGVLFCFGCLVFFIAYRNKPIIKVSQPVFLVTFSFSSLLANLWPVITLGPQTELSCALSATLPSCVFTIYFGALVVKLYRVYLLLFSDKAKQLKRIKVRARHVMGLLSVWIFFDLCVIIGWILISPLYEVDLVEPSNVDDVIPDLDQYNEVVQRSFTVYQCAFDENSKLFKGAFILSHITLVGTGVFYTLQLRGVQNKLAEKHVIGNIVQQSAVLTALCSIVIIPSSGVPVDVQNLFMFSCVMIATVSANLQMVISKIKEGLNTEVTADDFRISEHGHRISGQHDQGRDTDLSGNRGAVGSVRGSGNLRGGSSSAGNPSGVYRSGAGGGFQSTFKKKGEAGDKDTRTSGGNIEMGSIEEGGESGVFNQSNPMREAQEHNRK
ncbi:hypothetical protein TrVE_jg4144 [Triparma verrucosa]|uniref:G-protein coupled receptors family 3 profile domain-containing protein n=1 Tax=Triparma verrucosa TaxID=1606542 RepID=A0A9W7ETU5_9STRA|nr:hypothetical protein TrVE_jg4144 [Triparma verrucosa]